MALTANSSVCFSFKHDNVTLRKTAWLVPHVVKHEADSELISWRCNWGHQCESGCFYAMGGRKETQAAEKNNTLP